MRNSPILRCLLLLTILTGAVLVRAGDSDEGHPAPRFSAKTIAGEKFTNESVKGKVVLLQFWATWCKYCRADQPMVDQLDHEFADKGFITLAIDVGEDKKTVKRYLEQNPRSCRIVLTGDTNLAAMFAANSYPIYVLIDRDGKIAGEQHGSGGARALRRLLSRAGLETQEDSN
jgi:thiol-disulfide isomerase/thioredoxin